MGRLIVGADVGLYLDDPADAAPAAIRPDKARTEQRPRRGEGVLRQEASVERFDVRTRGNRTVEISGRRS
jgi:hypothetical protein